MTQFFVVERDQYSNYVILNVKHSREKAEEFRNEYMKQHGRIKGTNSYIHSLRGILAVNIEEDKVVKYGKVYLVTHTAVYDEDYKIIAITDSEEKAVKNAIDYTEKLGGPWERKENEWCCTRNGIYNIIDVTERDVT